MSEDSKEGSSYDESTIQVLEGTEGVRLRPAMYIGDVGSRGLHHLVYEVIDNSIDEAMANRCSMVDVKIHTDNSVSLMDDGAGIPAGIHPKYGVSTLEVILTKLHSGGKFEKKAYQVSGGLHGVGLAAVCALSEWFIVKSYRDGLIYTQRYEKGKKASEVTTEPIGDNSQGTLIHFKPDTSIFDITKYDKEILTTRFRELAYLTTKFRINFTDLRLDEEGNIHSESFYFEGGIQQFVEYSIGSKTALSDPLQIFYTFGVNEDVVVEVALTYTESYSESVRGFVNNINTTEGGTHITGFRQILTQIINEFARESKILKDKEANLGGNDVRDGIVAVLSVKIPSPQFEGQTKTKLGNSEVAKYVRDAIREPLKNWLIDNPEMGKAIVNKAINARRASEAAKKASDLIRGKGKARINKGKLVSARTKDRNIRELFLVEGQSAGGTAVKGRDAEYQEILFLRGKVLNVEKARLDRALDNKEIQSIIAVVGADIKNEFVIQDCRYNKVILLTDADVDGAHIATLLLTFFYRYMHPLVEDGRLYIARPPLFQVNLTGEAANFYSKEKEAKAEAEGKSTKKVTKFRIFLVKEKDLEVFMMGFNDFGFKKSEMSLNRFKGLGEMNAEQLEETCMHIDTRSVAQILIADDFDAEDWLVKLMGDEVEHRKKFIRSDVFFETGLKDRGPFFNAGFVDVEPEADDTGIEGLEEVEDMISKRQIAEEFDEYSPGQKYLDALDEFEF
jgi:DNA gyrase subunit B